ncbi:SgrR family transcriptional regulator [Vibrio atlanticus]|uniref:ABC type uncharacterized transport system n=1 Tax=Vibrio atlanticus (strain LGP32) TaxID=575788 RepID=B7VRP1_VIBA3|nr:SgrR family transcriptional regulator [Vibrio atlanticus]CAV26264.1 ABC type uncharacterized transport system [Vibrio atlanticus]
MEHLHQLSSSHLKRLRQLERKFNQNLKTEVTITDLAEILFCSERNVSKLMVSLESQGILKWLPGRGRGNHSKLTLVKNFEDALFDKIEGMVQGGKMNEAFILAQQFDCVWQFQNHLPQWLDEAKQRLKQQNTLMYVVPYSLPEWRPHLALSTRSILMIESVFDTLVRFDSEQQEIKPYLAHQVDVDGLQIRVRIRNNIQLHNGEMLTPEMVKTNFDMRCKTTHPYQILFRHLVNIEVEKQWIVFYLDQHDPVFLHLLADIHSAIFDLNSDTPVGSGAYQVERLEPHRWSLIRNTHYFAFGGHIERAEFWSSNELPISAIHVEESCWTYLDPTDSKDIIEHSGCTVLQFPHHKNVLSNEELSWIVHYSRAYVNGAEVREANSIMHCHQEKGFHLFNRGMKRPSRPVVFEVKDTHRAEIQPLLSALRRNGLDLLIKDKAGFDSPGSTDVFYDCYAFGDDIAFQYYEWLLCGDVFTRCLSNDAKKSLLSFVDALMRESISSSEFLQKLHRAEDWLIQNYYYCPLWRDHIAYRRADNVYGTDTSSMGVMTLSNMWLE